MKAKANGETKGYQERNYRHQIIERDLVSFQVKVKETDLYIRATKNLPELAYQSILRHRYQLEQYIRQKPQFFHSLVPMPADEFAPPLVKEMLRAAQVAEVGPMAAVAGAMAEFVGRDLLREAAEVVVENGGDIFICAAKEIKVGIFAGTSPLSFRIGIKVSASDSGWGVCTSSGTVGPSISFGRADAVCVVSSSASLADAAATAVGNLVLSPADLSKGLERARTIPNLTGVVIIIEDKLGAWGDMELVEL